MRRCGGRGHVPHRLRPGKAGFARGRTRLTLTHRTLSHPHALANSKRKENENEVTQHPL